MHLQYPQFLWTLSLIIIPVILHLFNLQRHKTIYFSDLSLLKSIEIESRKKSKLKNLLLLLTRIFMIACIVIAFCQPIFNTNPNSTNTNSSEIGIYLDNSFSMSRSENNQSLFNKAKNDVLDLINLYNQETNFLITTNKKSLNKSYSLNQEQAIDFIQRANLCGENLNLDQIFTIQKEQFKNKKIQNYWFTDLQKNSFTPTSSLDSSINTHVNLIYYENNSISNVSIDSIWFKENERKILVEDEIYVKVKNWSNSIVDVQLKLVINENELVTQKLIKLNHFEEKEISIKYLLKKEGVKKGVIYINDANLNDVVYDDKLIFNYSTIDLFKVLYIYDDSSYNKNAFSSLFRTIKEVEFKFLNINDGFSLSDLDCNLIILDELKQIPDNLSQNLRNQTIIFIPSVTSKSSIKNSNQFLSNYNITLKKSKTNKSRLNENYIDKDFFKNVFKRIEDNMDLPYFNSSLELSSDYKLKSILKYEDNQDFLVRATYNSNSLFLFTSSFQEKNSNISKHALFVPLMLKIKDYASVNQQIYYELPSIKPISISSEINQSGQLLITSDESDKTTNSFYPTVKSKNGTTFLYMENQIENDGHYNIFFRDSIIKTFSVNYNRNESNLDFFSVKDFETSLKNNELNQLFSLNEQFNKTQIKNIASLQARKDYWIYFVVLALIFIILEIIIIKYYEKSN
ncbi:MAG: BatA domain-containing protein [Bacteroidota bacterium]|nr:BatA domain-containing protein [Bacteroidota bacterium]